MGLDLPYLEDRALMLSAKVQRLVVPHIGLSIVPGPRPEVGAVRSW